MLVAEASVFTVACQLIINGANMRSWLFLAAAIVVSPSLAAEPNGTKWEYATSVSVIGLNPPFLERKLGPAKSKDHDSWTFEVGRCDVTYYINSYGVIGFTFKLKKGCETILWGFQDQRGYRLTAATTFADIEQLHLFHGHFAADCLEGCGNAADPVVSFKAEGSRSSGGYDISFEVPVAGSDALEAAGLWTTAYKKKYHLTQKIDLPSDVANCDATFEKLVEGFICTYKGSCCNDRK